MGRISTKPNPTARVIAEMLRENTGGHFLDSGGAYGRHWQRNASRGFEAEPAVALSFEYEIEVGLNVYHFLRERLEYDPAMDRRFQDFCGKPEKEDEGWLEMAMEFARDDADGGPYMRNTYNGEDLLSQVIQYVGFRDAKSEKSYVLLQVHGGCDVRGGYTRPRAFLYNEEDCDYSLMDNAKARIACRRGGKGGIRGRVLHAWDTDDGYHWYPSHYAEIMPSEGTEASRLDALLKTNLEAFETRDARKGEESGVGYLLVGRREGSCPICLAPLEAY